MGVLFSPVIAQPARAVCALAWVEGSSLLQRASLRLVGGTVPAGTVRIEYLGHLSFLVELPAGATVVTDFNGFVARSFVPDIVMMNNAHDTHYTDYPDSLIKFVLRGWRAGGGIASHNPNYKGMRVRNVPTNVGEFGDPRTNNNSVFVIEVAGLCIGHPGRLHHVLTRDQLMLLGRIDILFVPVDGGMTMSHAQALANIKLIDPRLVIPMHFGFLGSPNGFFEAATNLYPIPAEKGSVLLVRRKTLPKATEIRFLQGQQ